MDIALATPQGVALCGSDHLHIFVYYYNHYPDDSISAYLLLCDVIVKKPLAHSMQKVWDGLFHILQSLQESWSLLNFTEFCQRVQPSHVLVRQDFNALLLILQTTNLSAPTLLKSTWRVYTQPDDYCHVPLTFWHWSITQWLGESMHKFLRTLHDIVNSHWPHR